MAKPILNLDTLVRRDVVAIDGQPYELRNPGELSLLEQTRLGHRGKEMEDLRDAIAQRSPTADDVATITAVLDEMTRIVLMAPPEVISRLNDQQKNAVIVAFTQPRREMAATAAAPLLPAQKLAAGRRAARKRVTRSTGASSSRA